jgi:hypothetical protein
VEHKTKIAISRKKSLFSEETKAKMSESHMGERNGRYNKGTPVYLYEVHPTLVGVPMPPEGTGYELSAICPNICRCSSALAINRNTVSRRIASY